jgi:hypothetical protein
VGFNTGAFAGTVVSSTRRGAGAQDEFAVMFDADGATVVVTIGSHRYRILPDPNSSAVPGTEMKSAVAAAPAGAAASAQPSAQLAVELDCLICFDTPAGGTSVRTLRCGHGFCEACIVLWWRTSPANSCPTCRQCFAGFRGSTLSTVPADEVNVNVESENPDTANLLASTNVNLFAKHHQTLERITPDHEAAEEVEVQSIMDKRVHSNVVQYKVRWKGHGIDEDTWEPARHLSGAAAVVARFEKGLEQRRAGQTPRGHAVGSPLKAASITATKTLVENNMMQGLRGLCDMLGLTSADLPTEVAFVCRNIRYRREIKCNIDDRSCVKLWSCGWGAFVAAEAICVGDTLRFTKRSRLEVGVEVIHSSGAASLAPAQASQRVTGTCTVAAAAASRHNANQPGSRTALAETRVNTGPPRAARHPSPATAVNFAAPKSLVENGNLTGMSGLCEMLGLSPETLPKKVKFVCGKNCYLKGLNNYPHYGYVSNGWNNFVTAERVRVGDTLRFTKRGRLEVGVKVTHHRRAISLTMPQRVPSTAATASSQSIKRVRSPKAAVPSPAPATKVSVTATKTLVEREHTVTGMSGLCKMLSLSPESLPKKVTFVCGRNCYLKGIYKKQGYVSYGWADFVTAESVHVGDTLLFTKRGRLKVGVELVRSRSHKRVTVSQPAPPGTKYRPTLKAATSSAAIKTAKPRNAVKPVRAAVHSADQLAVGSIMLAQDQVGKWLRATVVAAEDERVRVHFLGWSAGYDEWLPRRSGKLRPAKSGARGGGERATSPVAKAEQRPTKRPRFTDVVPVRRSATGRAAKSDSVALSSASAGVASSKLVGKPAPLAKRQSAPGNASSEHGSATNATTVVGAAFAVLRCQDPHGHGMTISAVWRAIEQTHPNRWFAMSVKKALQRASAMPNSGIERTNKPLGLQGVLRPIHIRRTLLSATSAGSAPLFGPARTDALRHKTKRPRVGGQAPPFHVPSVRERNAVSRFGDRA